MKKITFLTLFVAITCAISAQNEPKLGKNSTAEVIAAMTLEEKVHLLVGNGMKLPGMPQIEGAPVVGQTNDNVPGCAGTTYGIPRLGIPSIVLADGPAGVRISPTREGSDKKFYCTAFPVATLLASSWDADLVRRAGEAMGNEAKEYGVDILLAPALNIHRNALGGRNFEYYSEDPLVSGKMATAMIKGIQSQGVGTSAKHFAVNNQETNRNLVNVKVSERALREIYLKNFEIVVKEGKPMTMMSSYNKINGTYASHSGDLLIKILREDWGYKGAVMTDWFGGDDAVAQAQAMNDWLMPGTPKQYEAIFAAVKEGRLSEAIINKNVENILNVIVQTNTFKGIQRTNAPDLKKNAETARALAAEGMVLLKNEKSSLPLKAKAKVAVFGNGSYEFIAGGTGSGDVNEAYTVALQDGLLNAGFSINQMLKTAYEGHIKTERAKQEKPKFFFMGLPPITEYAISEDQISEATKDDIAMITIGRNSGEFVDRKADVDFELSAAEKELIASVSKKFHAVGKKVVVVLNIGGTIEIASWRDQVDAILLAWQPGQEGGNAVADVLSGKVNPSGKLATTFPMAYKDEPTTKNFPGKDLEDKMRFTDFGMPIGKLSEVTHEEGIYVGYRYYNTFKVKTAYEFGYGKSYTNFNYKNLKVSKNKNGKFKASITITNTGKYAGKEVVQLYVSAPDGSLEKPEKELKAFAKTKLLKSGESQTINFELTPEELASFDENNSRWVLEKGNYEIKVGASCNDIRQKASLLQNTTLLLKKVNKALSPNQKMIEMSKKKA